MTTVKQLLDSPIGYKTGGFVLQVAHTHKMREKYGAAQGPERWVHEVTLTDGTDEIKADVLLVKKRKFCRLEEIKIIVCEIIPESSGGYGKKLLVHEYEMITCTADELPDREYRPTKSGPDWEAIGRGKVKCRLLEAAIKNGILALDPLSNTDKVHNEFVRAEIARNADWVMSPEDKYDE